MISSNSDNKSLPYVITGVCFTAAALAVSASSAVAKTDQSLIPEATSINGISSSNSPSTCWKKVEKTTNLYMPHLTEVDQGHHGGKHHHHIHRTGEVAHHVHSHGEHRHKHPYRVHLHFKHHVSHPHKEHSEHIRKLLENRANAHQILEQARAATDKKRAVLGEWLKEKLTRTELVPVECPVSAPGAGGGGAGGGGVSTIPSNPTPSQTVVPPTTVPESGSSPAGNVTPTYPTDNCNDLFNYCDGDNNGGGLDIIPPPKGWWPPGGGGSGGWPTGGGSISAAPEPSSWVLMIGGLGAVGFALRRRQDKQPTLG